MPRDPLAEPLLPPTLARRAQASLSTDTIEMSWLAIETSHIWTAPTMSWANTRAATGAGMRSV